MPRFFRYENSWRVGGGEGTGGKNALVKSPLCVFGISSRRGGRVTGPFSTPVATTASEIRRSFTKLQLAMILKIQTKDAPVHCPSATRALARVYFAQIKGLISGFVK